MKKPNLLKKERKKKRQNEFYLTKPNLCYLYDKSIKYANHNKPLFWILFLYFKAIKEDFK